MESLTRHALAVTFFMTAALSGPLAGGSAGAETYPARPVTLVVPFGSGGGIDIVARIVAEKLQEKLHQPVVVENRPGGGGMVGTSSVAHAKADGYTLLLIEASSVLAKWLHKKVPFNVETDFTPIAMVATNYLGLFGDASLPANNLAELVRYSKAHPAKLSVGIPGIGTPHHLAALMFERSTGLELVHVTYRGSPPSVSDLVAGRIPLVWAVPINVMPFVAQGKAKLLAISSPRRLAALPHVATVAEQGLPGFDVTLWLGIAGPAGISAEIVSQLNTAMQAIAALPALQHRLATLGYTLDYGGGDKLREQMLSDHRKYGEVILKAGIEPN